MAEQGCLCLTGAGVCLPQPVQPSHSAQCHLPLAWEATLAARTRRACICMPGEGARVSPSSSFRSHLLFLPDPTVLGGGGTHSTSNSPGLPSLLPFIHSVCILHSAQRRFHRVKGFNLYIVDSCASRPPYHNIIRLHAHQPALGRFLGLPNPRLPPPLSTTCFFVFALFAYQI